MYLAQLVDHSAGCCLDHETVCLYGYVSLYMYDVLVYSYMHCTMSCIDKLTVYMYWDVRPRMAHATAKPDADPILNGRYDRVHVHT